ncbi:hypothetical protein BH11PSE2_BH11PSE2_21870 [soil metagenome]
MERRLAAKQVAEKLHAVETQIDQTLIAAGALISALPGARERAKVSAVVGQDAFALVAQATVILTQARGKFVEAHHALAQTGRDLGIPAKAIQIGDKPVPPPATNEIRTAEVVSIPHAA